MTQQQEVRLQECGDNKITYLTSALGQSCLVLALWLLMRQPILAALCLIPALYSWNRYFYWRATGHHYRALLARQEELEHDETS